MLVKDVSDNAGNLVPRDALGFFASKLAPAEGSPGHRFFQEKLQISAHIWYKVSRSERVSYNGITPASQADNEGSIPFTRSTQILLSRQDGFDGGGIKKPALGGRFFYGWNLP